MNRKTWHWIFFLLGLATVIGVAYCYLTIYTKHCMLYIFDGTHLNPDKFWSDFLYIPGSLLLTGLLFYLAGRSMSSSSVDKEDNDTLILKKELDECRKQYDALMVQSSGGKITSSTATTASKKSSFWVDTKKEEASLSNSLTEDDSSPKSDLDAQIEAKKAELKDSSSATLDKTSVKAVFGKNIKEDDLKIVEGIGPKIASILNDRGINTWADLASESADKIREYLVEAGGPTYKIHNPDTWPKQAQMAAEGKFLELSEWQAQLKGGIE